MTIKGIKHSHIAQLTKQLENFRHYRMPELETIENLEGVKELVIPKNGNYFYEDDQLNELRMSLIRLLDVLSSFKPDRFKP